MSRSYKPRGYFRRYVKNSYIQKMSEEWGSDLYHRRKDRTISRKIRAREKRRNRREISNEYRRV